MEQVSTRRRTGIERFADVLSEALGWYRLAGRLRGVTISGGARIKSPSLFRAGRNVAIQAGCFIHCGGKAWSDHVGGVVLGDHVTLGPGCAIYGAGGVTLGRSVHLGPGAKLLSQAGRHDATRLGPVPTFEFAPIVVGDGAWIGAGAVVLPGAVIGRCATIAPNSVVTGHVADNAIHVGNPGRTIMYNEPLAS